MLKAWVVVGKLLPTAAVVAVFTSLFNVQKVMTWNLPCPSMDYGHEDLKKMKKDFSNLWRDISVNG
jgi:hypothetical protein